VSKKLRAYLVRADATGPITFLASSPAPARDGFAIPVKAWDLGTYRRNPVLLWSHGWSAPPIGKVTELRATERGLVGSAVFDQKDAFARQIESKVRAGFLNAVSVGFDIHGFEPDGKTVTQAELLDISIVSIPADANALIEARSAYRALGRGAGSRPLNEAEQRRFLLGLRDAAIRMAAKADPIGEAVRTAFRRETGRYPTPTEQRDLEVRVAFKLLGL
jgi:HK97 family phage prohead protease